MLEVSNTELQGYSFIDLFAGIGGFRLALESLGAKCVFSSEINGKASKTYYENFGEWPSGDITQIDEKDIPEHDILCGGFPCQAFSAAGAKLGFSDVRGTLFFDVARIVKFRQPKVVFLENVDNLVIHDNGRTFAVIKSTMEELGYFVSWKVLNSANYDVPQQRKRTYIICFRNDLGIKHFEFPYPMPLTCSVKDILLEENSVPNNLYRDVEVYAPSRKPRENSDEVKLFGFFNKGRQGERVYRIDGVAITIATKNKGYYLVSPENDSVLKIRRLHVRECARLMGFPDSFVIPKAPGMAEHQLGNAVVVNVIQRIAVSIARTLNDEEDDFFLC